MIRNRTASRPRAVIGTINFADRSIGRACSRCVFREHNLPLPLHRGCICREQCAQQYHGSASSLLSPPEISEWRRVRGTSSRRLLSSFLSRFLALLFSFLLPSLLSFYFLSLRRVRARARTAQVFSLAFRVPRNAFSRFNFLAMHKALYGGRRRRCRHSAPHPRRRHRRRRRRRGRRDAPRQLVARSHRCDSERALRGRICRNLRLRVNPLPLAWHHPAVPCAEDSSAKWVSLFSAKWLPASRHGA